MEAKELKSKKRWEKGNLNAMLQAVKFPAGIADLNTGLTNVDGNALSHCGFERE